MWVSWALAVAAREDLVMVRIDVPCIDPCCGQLVTFWAGRTGGKSPRAICGGCHQAFDLVAGKCIAVRPEPVAGGQLARSHFVPPDQIGSGVGIEAG